MNTRDILMAEVARRMKRIRQVRYFTSALVLACVTWGAYQAYRGHFAWTAAFTCFAGLNVFLILKQTSLLREMRIVLGVGQR